MNLDAVFSGPWGPVLIFFLRIADVSLFTMRMLLMMRDQRRIVPFIAFFEVLIWTLAAGSAIHNLSSMTHLMGYAVGFSSGNVVGMWLERKLAVGFSMVRVITKKGDRDLARTLRSKGFGVTELTGQGKEGPVAVLLTVVRRRNVESVFDEVRRADADAFVTLEEPKVLSSSLLSYKGA